MSRGGQLAYEAGGGDGLGEEDPGGENVEKRFESERFSGVAEPPRKKKLATIALPVCGVMIFLHFVGALVECRLPSHAYFVS